MRPTFGIFVILSALVLAGCATPAVDYEKAAEINSVEGYKAFLQKHPYSPYTHRAKNKIAELQEAERRISQIEQNWGKLRKGMSVDEVDSLIGPLNRGAVSSIKYLYENKNASSGKVNPQKSADGYPYRGRYFTLQFDASGKLSEWSLK